MMAESRDTERKASGVSAQVIAGVVPKPVLILAGVDAQVLNIKAVFKTHGVSAKLPALRLIFEYDGFRTPADNKPSFDVMANGKKVTVHRKISAEMAHWETLKDLASGFKLASDFAKDVQVAKTPPHTLILWPFNASKPLGIGGGGYRAAFLLQRVVPQLTAQGWIIDKRMSWPFDLMTPQTRLVARATENKLGFLRVEPMVEVEGSEFPLRPILLDLIRQLPDGWTEDSFDLQAHLAERKMLIPVSGGKYAGISVAPLIPFLKIFTDLVEDSHLGDGGKIIRIRDTLTKAGIDFQGGERILDLSSRQRDLYANPSFDGPFPGFVGSLREYQVFGFRWLQALSETDYGALLADDMGLGKTFQTMAHLAAIYAEMPNRPQTLIVATASTLAMWKRELLLHAPDLHVALYHGADRDKDVDVLLGYDILVTTYAVVTRDQDILSKMSFDTIVIDECQAAKNRTSQIARTLRKLQARHRIALSGTPMENNLGEFWAIMDWLNPGLLGDHKAFRERFRKPIETYGDKATMEMLKLRTSPFILRRTKDQVASELPTKTIITEYISMSEPQYKVYESLRLLADKEVRNTLQERGVQKGRFNILSSLLKLRQVCCDPRLLKLQSDDVIAESAKLEFLMEMLEDLISEGRRALIFSQFVEMLELIEAEVRARGWSYEMLTGATRNRQDMVDRFQNGEASLFLLSLKAGGAGLTLTAADTVILYDPWWNPAVERQAMDRAHRIGQDKPVFVYRLIMERTIESRVELIQGSKSALTDALLDAEGGGTFKMSEQEILSLFAPIDS